MKWIKIGEEVGEKLGEVEAGEDVIRIYKNLFSIKRKMRCKQQSNPMQPLYKIIFSNKLSTEMWGKNFTHTNKIENKS